MANNYREYGYDVNSPQLLRQIQEDNNEAKEIEKRAKEIRDEKGKEITQNILCKEEVSEEDIEDVLSNYAMNGNEYLVGGATLVCDKASRGPVKVKIGNAIVEFEGNNSISYKYTRLSVDENGQSSNGLYVATVDDTVQGVNIIPFRCNCSLLPDRQWEIDKIKNNLGCCKTYGTCSQLMNLDNKWDNLPSDIGYFTYVDKSIDGSEEKEGINMMSMLFCKHGGLITPVSSGQIKFNIKEIFGDFNLEENDRNGNPLAKQLIKLNFSQDKVDLIIESTKELYQTYYIVIDPISLLSIIAQEGTGSFNTSSTNLAADGQHGVEKNFAVDLMAANNLIFGKTLGFMLYGSEFIDIVNSNKELLGVEEGNFAQYANWTTPIIKFSSQSIYAAYYAGDSAWHDGVEFFYESVRGEDGMKQYTEYISCMDKRMVYSILDDNNIKMVTGSFKVEQNGQDSKGNYNGTYTVIWEEK